MSKPARTSTPGTKLQPPPLPTHDAGRVSGARRALNDQNSTNNYAAYDGLMQLGSEAFSAPLPPPKSERPRFAAPRIHAGWYMISAAAGFSVGAVVLAIVFKPSLEPERPPVSLAQSTGYIGPWTLVSNNQPMQMREVLEPAQPIASASALPAAIAKVEAERPAEVATNDVEAEPKVEAAEAELPANAPVIAAATAPSEPASAEPSEPAAAAREARASQHDGRRGHHRERERRAAPVAQLSRAQVIATMQKVQSQVSACFRGTSGTAMADITIVGRTGRVTTAQVSGQNGAVGSCIARAVRGATFPTFKAETLSIRYPFAH
jgi:hypothetical protein